MPDPLHPAVVHLPIALAVLVPLGALAALLAIWKGFLPARSWWGVVLLSGIWLWLGGAGLPGAGGEVYLQAALLGIGGIVIMTLTVQYGVSHMPVQRSAVILLFEIVAGAISAQLLADEPVLLREWLGGGLIVLAGYLAARRAESCEI